MESSFQAALGKRNDSAPPIWFMRQAGRYHKHYQALRKQHSFIDLCKIPQLAVTTTLGPMEAFDFDAAIVFSDLLFPLEALGLGLAYAPGPKLSKHIRTLEDVIALEQGSHLAQKLLFQKEALVSLKNVLPVHKGLIGFVGGIFTLFAYAVEGTHKYGIPHTLELLRTPLWDAFYEKIHDLMLQNMLDQASAGIDVLAIMDTCAGDVDPKTYHDVIVPKLRSLVTDFGKKSSVPILYYSKNTSWDHWRSLEDIPLQGLGIDWKTPLSEVLQHYGRDFCIQGNFDPHYFLASEENFIDAMRKYYEPLSALYAKDPKACAGWIAGLGHGMLPGALETYVHQFLAYHRKVFQKG